MPVKRLQMRTAAQAAAVALAAALVLAACGTAGPGAAPAAAEPAATQPAAAALPTATPQPAAPITATGEITAGAAPAEPAAAPTALPPFDPAATPLGLDLVVDGLELPVAIANAGDGRLFVIEKPGRIRIVQDGALLQAPFLDITDRVGSSANEQGLLGLAFPPTYGDTGLFFVNYTNRSGDTVVSRFQMTDDPIQADPNSEAIVLTLDQPAANHNGGHLAFGPDGMLWIGTGDGGAANDRFNNGQNPNTLLGKMLRLDVTSNPAQPYTIPADNPWVSATWNGLDVRDEIWALGLRNPWRYSFDRATGDLYVADVGQNQYEEVNYIPAGTAGGLNFGWPIMEAGHCFLQDNCSPEGLALPVLEYDHSGHCSITGGYAYRGGLIPTLAGAYVYGDYCSGVIWVATPDGSGGWTSQQVMQVDAPLTSFGEDEAGELYIVDYAGRLLRIAPS